MIPSKRHLLYPLLAVGLTLALAPVAGAQGYPGRTSPGVSGSLRVSFGAPLHWTAVTGTRVEELPANERPGYDMFRYGGTYYAYNNNRWYSSPTESGEFRGVDDQAVPTEFSTVPRDHWRNYPTGWQDRQNQAPMGTGTAATLRVNLGASSHWAPIHGTSVEELPTGERPNHDMFRSGGAYYARSNDRWYTSRTPSGDYTPVDERQVPQEFSNIPRDHWQSYPTGWGDRRDMPRERSNATFQVSLRSDPGWRNIHGSRVQQIRSREIQGYDMFRFNGAYYVYDNHQWYTSRRGHGQFSAISSSDVPRAVHRVPRDHWRNYPSDWNDGSRDRRTGDAGYGNR
jgi:hypothetical protein